MDNTSPFTSNKQRATRFLEIEYPTIYSNVIGIGATPYDLTVVFGLVDSATEDEVLAKPAVKVLMAPEQAANLVKILNEMLARFKEANGELRTAATVSITTMATPE
jgi:Protein of unknown function (DUF3467)